VLPTQHACTGVPADVVQPCLWQSSRLCTCQQLGRALLNWTFSSAIDSLLFQATCRLSQRL
jgi:hypothetical protein